MHYTDAADNVGGQFIDGDVNLGKKGTVVDASWLQAVQDELCNVVTASGAELDKENDEQVKEAIPVIVRKRHEKTIENISWNGNLNVTERYTKQIQGNLRGAFFDISLNVVCKVSGGSTDDFILTAWVEIPTSGGSVVSFTEYSITNQVPCVLPVRWCFAVPQNVPEETTVKIIFEYTNSLMQEQINATVTGSANIDLFN